MRQKDNRKPRTTRSCIAHYCHLFGQMDCKQYTLFCLPYHSTNGYYNTSSPSGRAKWWILCIASNSISIEMVIYEIYISSHKHDGASLFHRRMTYFVMPCTAYRTYIHAPTATLHSHQYYSWTYSCISTLMHPKSNPSIQGQDGWHVIAYEVLDDRSLHVIAYEVLDSVNAWSWWFSDSNK